jgi:putative ABC transport system permease protein
MSLSGDFEVQGGPKLPGGYWADKMAVSPEYFRAMGIRLLQGRFFTSTDDAGGPGAVIISQTIADRFWPAGDALGQQISMWQSEPKVWLTIVGVVEDVLQREITGERGAALYQPYAQVRATFFLGHMTFVVRSQATPQAIGPALRAAIHTADANLPVQNIARMDELVSSMSSEPLFQTRLLALFALIALALCAVGVYGVLSYVVTQRRFEIGIRMALGARATDVMKSVLTRTCALTLPGILLGAAGAFTLTRLLNSFLFGVKPTDPLTFGAVALVLSLTAFLAGWLPARRAARVDPMNALRAD